MPRGVYPRNPRGLSDRFWPKVQRADGCWLWLGARNNGGYGKLCLGQRGAGWMHAHRVSFELHFGPIPNGLIVRHRCDNPPCVRPDHLELGTMAQNQRDMSERGRAAVGMRSATVKLTLDQVLAIRASADTTEVLARAFGVNKTTISKIRLRRTWQHV